MPSLSDPEMRLRAVAALHPFLPTFSVPLDTLKAALPPSFHHLDQQPHRL